MLLDNIDIIFIAPISLRNFEIFLNIYFEVCNNDLHDEKQKGR